MHCWTYCCALCSSHYRYIIVSHAIEVWWYFRFKLFCLKMSYKHKPIITIICRMWLVVREMMRRFNCFMCLLLLQMVMVDGYCWFVVVIRKIFDFGLKTVGSVPNPECVRLKRLLMFWMLKMTTIRFHVTYIIRIWQNMIDILTFPQW